MQTGPWQYRSWTSRYGHYKPQSRSKPFYQKSIFCISVCTCLPGYTGNPLSHCVRGECQSDSECSDSRACINYSCVDPCLGQCGANAICEAQRHIAVCKCPRGYDGNAASSCVRQSRAYYPYSRYYKKKWTAHRKKLTPYHWQILDLNNNHKRRHVSLCVQSRPNNEYEKDRIALKTATSRQMKSIDTHKQNTHKTVYNFFFNEPLPMRFHINFLC